MNRSLTRMQAALVGLLVLTGAAAAGYGLFAVGDRQRLWADTMIIHVGFEKIQGVGIGTSVRVRGLEAGAVEAIDLPAVDRPDAPLILKLRLDRRFSPMLFADATAQIRSEGMVGGKVIEIESGSATSGSLSDGAVIASKSAADFNEVIDQAAAMVNGIKNGEGALGKLIKDDKVYREVTGAIEQTKQLMQKSQDAVNSIQQDADALKRLPIVRGYVEDTTALLVRHTGDRYRKVFATDQLFEPSRAVLTEAGKARLQELAPWFAELRIKNSELVVVAYADPTLWPNPQVAHTLTVRQAEVVSQYLQDQLSAHKLGWFSRRAVHVVGQGTRPAPVAESEPLPTCRVEVIVFVP